MLARRCPPGVPAAAGRIGWSAPSVGRCGPRGPRDRTSLTERMASRSSWIQSASCCATSRTVHASASLRLRATPASISVSRTRRSARRSLVITGTPAVVNSTREPPHRAPHETVRPKAGCASSAMRMRAARGCPPGTRRSGPARPPAPPPHRRPRGAGAGGACPRPESRRGRPRCPAGPRTTPRGCVRRTRRRSAAPARDPRAGPRRTGSIGGDRRAGRSMGTLRCLRVLISYY